MNRRMSPWEMEWMDKAACRGEPSEKFFDHKQMHLGVEVCSGCEVRETCLKWRIDTVDPWDTDYGVWGGKTPVERDRIRKNVRGSEYYFDRR